MNALKILELKDKSLAKVGVVGSNPIARSRQPQGLRSMQASGFPALFAFWALGGPALFSRCSEGPWLPAGYKFAPSRAAEPHFLKPFSRCRRRNCECGRRWACSGRHEEIDLPRINGEFTASAVSARHQDAGRVSKVMAIFTVHASLRSGRSPHAATGSGHLNGFPKAQGCAANAAAIARPATAWP